MKITQNINYKELVESLNDEEIFQRYFGDFKIGGLFHAPYRRDNNASFSFYVSKSGRLKAKDFASGDNFTAIEYVMKIYNLDFSDAVKKIVADFNLENVDFKSNIYRDNTPKVRKTKKIHFQPKKFTEKDLQYWKQYNVDYELLRFGNVYSISKLWVEKEPYLIKDDELAFAYYFPKSNHTKIYLPERPKGKRFIGNVNNDEDVQFHWQINPKETQPELLILTKSYKECLFLYSYGIKAVALNGENHFPNKDYIRHLKKYCKVIKSLYDKDEAGDKGCQKLKELYDIDCITLPEECKYKDITDWYSKEKEQVEQFLKTII